MEKSSENLTGTTRPEVGLPTQDASPSGPLPAHAYHRRRRILSDHATRSYNYAPAKHAAVVVVDGPWVEYAYNTCKQAHTRTASNHYVPADSNPVALDKTLHLSAAFPDQPTHAVDCDYRYDNQRVAKWLNRDPIGETDGPNVYAFVHNCPTTFHDKLGLTTWPVTACSKTIGTVSANANVTVGGVANYVQISFTPTAGQSATCFWMQFGMATYYDAAGNPIPVSYVVDGVTKQSGQMYVDAPSGQVAYPGQGTTTPTVNDRPIPTIPYPPPIDKVEKDFIDILLCKCCNRPNYTPVFSLEWGITIRSGPPMTFSYWGPSLYEGVMPFLNAPFSWGTDPQGRPITAPNNYW